MYVTDVPVVDRITDRTAATVEESLYALETALCDYEAGEPGRYEDAVSASEDVRGALEGLLWPFQAA
jgi:hypothetical protein